MLLAPGTKIGPYSILSELGAGGMGEVYRGRDTKLDREVAIKVLPASVARDPERLARFEREAKVLASLNHPNIAQIYGVQEAEGYQALVMELVPGQTLAALIKTGAIALDESLRLAGQMVEALSAAHEKGITHRDFKPANVMITPEGVVKVLDFGLAAVSQPSSDVPAGSNVATLTMSPTSAGMIMGTAPYMSPEQARGNQADRRSDIFSFGVVLYEMLTGKQLFHGETVSDILASVLKDTPNLDDVPEQVRPLLQRCLQKDPRKRLQSIGDWDLLLAIGSGVGGAGVQAASAPSQSRFGAVSIAAAVLAVGLGAVSFIHFRETPPEQPRVQFGIPLPGKATNAMFDISPDGRNLVMVVTEGSRRQLWIRPLDSGAARALPDTEGASYPFWSPDSAYIGYFADGKLKKIAVSGGSPQTLCEIPGAQGGTWNKEGVILVAGSGLKRVSSVGGAPVDVTTAVPGDAHDYPVFLPDGRHFLFTINGNTPETIGIYIGSLDGTPPVRLLPDFSNAAYVPASGSGRNGYLLFRRMTTLIAQPFDPAQGKLSGEIFPVVEQVGISSNIGHGAFSVSTNGALIYGLGTNIGAISELVWMDRGGKRLGTLGKPGLMLFPALSPDETQVAVEIANPQSGTSDIWLFDIARKAMSRFTFGPGLITAPVWSPDGGSIAFASRGAAFSRDLYRKPVHGAGEQELLVRAAGRNAGPYDWSRDGKFLVYRRDDEKTKQDLWLVGMDAADRKPAPYLAAAYREITGQFSPDGKWMAYVSDESGQDQVYIRSIPPTRPPVQVSIAGGSEPRWRRDGRELFYVSTDQKLMAVPIRLTGDRVDAATPQSLFDFAPLGVFAGAFDYQPTADGQRFLALVPASDEAPAPITVVLNWQTGLKK